MSKSSEQRNLHPGLRYCALAAVAATALSHIQQGSAADAAMSARAGYPERPIRLIVASAAGSSPDTAVRLVASQLAQQMGQQIVVDNRPGGGATIGTAAVASATPDGYTIGYGNVTTLAVNKTLLQRAPPYDVDRDLQPVVQIHYQSNALVVAPSLSFQTVTELIDHARSNPGKLLYGSTGNGSTSHLAAELLKAMTNTHMEHVPYKGSPQSINDLVGGQIHLSINNVVAVVPHVKSGRLRALAVTGLKRSAALPSLPTVAESGVPGYEVIAWGGLIAPSAVPKPVIAKLNAEVNKALALAAVKAQFAAMGSEPVGGSSAEFARYIKAESDKWGNIIRRMKIKPD